MASSNKTSHYNLSQYSANDKPTYLVDYNGDMLNIDTGIYNAQSKANVNEGNIGSLNDLTTTAKNSIVNAINEVVGVNETQTNNINNNTANISVNATSIGTLNNLDTTNKSNLVSAINEVNSNVKNLNLSIIEDITNITTSTGKISNSNIKVAKNNDGSLAKIYGYINISEISNQSKITITFPTSLRPSQELSLNSTVAIKLIGGTETINFSGFTIDTNGVVTLSNAIYNNNTRVQYNLIACLLLIKDFGDVVNP